ncbi:MAG: hypothetical protein IPP14_02455 [Planctomycetes bacterium]|nr:hypothetical protein [Planctomycetota bacterium]
MSETFAEALYLFRHAMLREVAYELHLPSDKAALHADVIAILLQPYHGDPPPSLTSELAWHAGRAIDAGDLSASMRRNRARFLGLAVSTPSIRTSWRAQPIGRAN